MTFHNKSWSSSRKKNTLNKNVTWAQPKRLSFTKLLHAEPYHDPAIRLVHINVSAFRMADDESSLQDIYMYDIYRVIMLRSSNVVKRHTRWH